MSKKPDVWMPFYIGDYLADTTHLTTEQHGAYLLLMMAAWKRGGALPNDPVQLATIARLPAQRWKQHAPVILAMFKADGDMLVQGRLAQEYAAAVAANDAQKANGKKGGRPRKEKPNESQQKPTGFNRANPNESPSPSPSPRACKNEASGHTPPSAAGSVFDHEGSFEGHPPGQDDATPNPVAAYAAALIRLGMRCTSLNPELIAYVDAGGTVDHLEQCAQLPDCAGKPAGYAIRIARRELAETARAIPPGRPRSNAPSKHLTGLAAILGVSPHDLTEPQPASTVVHLADRDLPGHDLRPEPRRLSGG